MARWDRNRGSTIPDWFWSAVETESTENTVEVDECDVFYREWKGTGTKDLLLIHGMYAHSRWWDFIAPQLQNDYRIVGLDLTGMGDSDFRYEYSGSTYVEEILSVCDKAGLSESVIVVGHSFGGRMAAKTVSMNAQRFGGLVLVDSGIRHPDEEEPDYPDVAGGRAKRYPDRATAESRFRLTPPQPCENEYILQYIAKHSVMPVEGGYSWKFDSDLPMTLKDVEADPTDYSMLDIPVALIYGEQSDSFTAQTHEYTRSLLTQPVRSIAIENARHHVFLDQPLDFVRELKSSLEWIASVSVET